MLIVRHRKEEHTVDLKTDQLHTQWCAPLASQWCLVCPIPWDGQNVCTTGYGMPKSEYDAERLASEFVI